MSYLIHLLNATYEVLRYIFVKLVLREPVSYPGDPIAVPLTRLGQWEDKEHFFDTSEWNFLYAEESHKKIEALLSVKLTGEFAGRQMWCTNSSLGNTNQKLVIFNPSKNPNSADMVLRNQMSNGWKGQKLDIDSTVKSARDAAIKGLSYYQILQCKDGHWAGDYGGPMFLMPGLIITLYVTKLELPLKFKSGMIYYSRVHQQVDGGWGTHIECASTMFGSILSYVSLRLLGEKADEPHMKKAREFIHNHGGALYSPSWAKFWLAVIGLYDWKGVNSVPVEMWLLPKWFIFHPSKMWCHARMVYLPMGYIYSTRYTPNVSEDPLLMELRSELYLEKYSDINWDSFRQKCASIDEYSPLNPVMKVAQDFLSIYENYILPQSKFFRSLRKSGLDFAMEYIHAEDTQTNFIDIGPVNKALNMLSVFVSCGENNQDVRVQQHFARVFDYLWVAEDGVKMQGYNGSQCWDTSFCAQAIVEGNLASDFPDCASKIYHYLERTQIAKDEENREKYFRHQSKGGWPFSTAAHGWPISDCTAEGLKAVLALNHSTLKSSVVALIPEDKRISDDRLKSACDVILSFHNEDGGWATYENNRGYGWYEMLNPSEVFGDIMIDYSYVECSSACITALCKFSKDFPGYRTCEVLNAISSGGVFLKSIQRTDGSWYGSWGNCFCYGTWFGIEGLIAAGEDPRSPSIRKAVRFLLDHQNDNGGWGESYIACVNKAYPKDGTGKMLGENGSGVVQTAWALLGLLAAKCEDEEVLKKARNFLMKKQLPNGDWNQEGITGVFNRSCGITYSQYRNIFPIWALVRYANRFEE